jgi:hypothetical protein
MTIMTGLEVESPITPDPNAGMDLDLQPIAGSPEEETEELPWGNDPATATWAPMMAEVNSSPRLMSARLTQATSRSSGPIGDVHHP